MNSETKKKVVLVEDEPEVRLVIRQLLEPYAQDLEVVEATNAEEAMDLFPPKSKKKRPDALILDLMMPYAKAAEELDADSDPDQIETGVHLLHSLREWEKGEENSFNSLPLWVAVITARNNPHLIQRLEQLLESRGRIYLKPFDEVRLEHDLAVVLGIDSQVDPDLLPPGYLPPTHADGGTR